MLAVDDLHWCDRASLSFIAYLAGRLEGQPILVATTLRSTDPGIDPALVADVAHAPATRPIRPGPLSAEAVAEVVRERLGPNAEPAFCEACHTATGGNPLLLGQLLRALESDGVKPDDASAGAVRDIGPRAVSRGVLLRLARLPGPAVDVARAVAVLGDGADLATITAFTGLEESVGGHHLGRRWPGPRSWPPTCRWPSCTRWCATPSTRSSHRPSASSSTPARWRSWSRPGRATSTWRRTCC